MNAVQRLHQLERIGSGGQLRADENCVRSDGGSSFNVIHGSISALRNGDAAAWNAGNDPERRVVDFKRLEIPVVNTDD